MDDIDEFPGEAAPPSDEGPMDEGPMDEGPMDQLQRLVQRYQGQPHNEPSDVEADFRQLPDPPTTHAVAARLSRGDLGRVPDYGRKYPSQGVYAVLNQLVDTMEQTGTCVPGQPVPPALAHQLNALGITDARQQCRMTLLAKARDIAQQPPKTDRRRLRGAKPGGVTDAAFRQLAPLEQAVIHINRARQMFTAGKGFILYALEQQRRGVGERVHLQQRLGSAMQSNVRDVSDDTWRQQPKTGKKSALSELWQAYQLVREYELNPPAPIRNGEPNPDRLAADKQYQFLMGTKRLAPNRLHIGSGATHIYYQSNVAPYHWYGVEPNEAPTIYTTATDEQAGLAHAVRKYLEQHPQTLLTYIPAEITPLEEWTDAARALANIHEHMRPPDYTLVQPFPTLAEAGVILFGPSDTANTYDTRWQGDNGANQYETAPRKLHANVLPPSYNNPYYPTGDFRNPDQPRSVPPNPVLGLPSPEMGYWDGRVAASLLMNRVTHAMNTVFELRAVRREHENAEQVRQGRKRPQEEPDERELVAWEGGPRREAPWWKRSTRLQWNPDNPPTEQQLHQAEEQTGIDYQMGLPMIPTPPPQRSQQFHFYNDAGQELTNPFEVAQKMLNMLFHALYLLNAPGTKGNGHGPPIEVQVPRSGQISRRELRGIGAPVVYTRVTVQSRKNVDGEGLVQRDNAGNLIPGTAGWARVWPGVLDNVSASAGASNLWYPAPLEYTERPYDSEHEQWLPANSDWRRGAQFSPIAVGPMLLDYRFGEDGDAVPNPAHKQSMVPNVWVVRTNAKSIFGVDTMGLVFW